MMTETRILMTDTEIKLRGIAALTDGLGQVEAERFIALILREPFNYTDWRSGLFEDRSIEEISRLAQEMRAESCAAPA
jgi:hypothetical protein